MTITAMHSVKPALFISILCLLWQTAASASDWPLYFDKITNDKYILVVLHEGGKAEYLHRETNLHKSVWLLHDSAATWAYFPNLPKNARPNIWVKTKQFRTDYFLEDKRLTEIDKMGVQNDLIKRKNTNPDTQ
jgi:hypothetical protein